MWRVLIVDDDKNNGDLLTAMMESYAACEISLSAKEAIRAYESAIKTNQPYDAVLLDVVMPQGNGLEVLKAIRQKEESSGVSVRERLPVLMLTAYREHFTHAYNSGCSDYILKPVEPERVKIKLKESIESR